jgi:transcriptional regulator with XRE-family HTH domain
MKRQARPCPRCGGSGVVMVDTVARLVRYHRERRRMTLVELAREIGITARTLENIEYLERSPSRSTLVALAKYFNVTVDELVDGKLRP